MKTYLLPLATARYLERFSMFVAGTAAHIYMGDVGMQFEKPDIHWLFALSAIMAIMAGVFEAIGRFMQRKASGE